MVGWLLPVERRGWLIRLDPAQAGGLPVLRASVPVCASLGQRRWERRMERAARRLADAGCRRALAPAGFLGWAAAGRQGLRPVETQGLCRTMAAALLLGQLAQRHIPPEQAVVGLYGRRVDRACYQAAMALCPVVRQLVVDVPEGGAELARSLRAEYGAAVLEGGGPSPHAAACFSPARQPPARAMVLYGPRPALGGLALVPAGVTPPAGADPAAFTALLWSCGRLPLRQIAVVQAADFLGQPAENP